MKNCYLNAICLMTFTSLVFAGCNGTDEIPQISNQATNDVPATNASARVSNAENKKSENRDDNEAAKLSMPDNFPSDIHVVDGAVSSDVQASGGKSNLILKYAESENDGLVEGYLKGMAESGWAQVASSELPIGTLTNFKKDDRKCTISVSPAKDELVTVAIVY